MALNMDWRNTPAYGEFLEEEAELNRNDFETIGFAMLATGMGPELKEKDVYEFWARCQVVAGLSEFSHTRDAYAAITREQIRGYINFRINASRDTRASWIKRQMDGAIQTAQYHDRQQKGSTTNG